MKKMKYIIGLGLSLFLASCTDALDLQPKIRFDTNKLL